MIAVTRRRRLKANYFRCVKYVQPAVIDEDVEDLVEMTMEIPMKIVVRT
jgi:hypothetical protein